MTIQAIETKYKGFRFRSRLEARWAVFFDAMRVVWTYENEGFVMDGTRYLPDFFLPDVSNGGMFAEIKPRKDYRKSRRIYLAGKITDDDWRDVLMNDLSKNSERYEVVGPLWHYRDHNNTNEFVVSECLNLVNSCDTVYLNLTTSDSIGSFVEVGYAVAKNKTFVLRFENEQVAEEAWFAEAAAYLDGAIISNTTGGEVSAPLIALLPQLSETFDKCQKLSTAKRVLLLQGDPMDVGINLFVDGQSNDWGTEYLGRFFSIFLNADSSRIKDAAIKARSARFEFGEEG